MKEYTNGEITIVWQPDLCIHSKICWNSVNGLPAVFQPKEKPWIKATAATSQAIMVQINKCPSGALSYFKNNNNVESDSSRLAENIVEVIENGPLIVYGNINVKDTNGCETKKNKATAFCRCGASSNKPYCDGTHTKIQFVDKRTEI